MTAAPPLLSGFRPGFHPGFCPGLVASALLLGGLSACAPLPEDVDPGQSFQLGGPADLDTGDDWWAAHSSDDYCERRAPPGDDWAGALDPVRVVQEPYAPADDVQEDLTQGVVVEDAVITNVGGSAGMTFWFAWGDVMFAAEDLSPEVPGIRPGDRVSFTVAEGGGKVVTAITDLRILERDNPVYVSTADIGDWDQALLYTNVRWRGMIGSGEACGSSATCFDVPIDDPRVVMRINNSAGVEPGSCIEVLGALGSFNEELQLNMSFPGNEEWIREYDHDDSY